MILFVQINITAASIEIKLLGVINQRFMVPLSQFTCQYNIVIAINWRNKGRPMVNKLKIIITFLSLVLGKPFCLAHTSAIIHEIDELITAIAIMLNVDNSPIGSIPVYCK